MIHLLNCFTARYTEKNYSYLTGTRGKRKKRNDKVYFSEIFSIFSNTFECRKRELSMIA